MWGGIAVFFLLLSAFCIFTIQLAAPSLWWVGLTCIPILYILLLYISHQNHRTYFANLPKRDDPKCILSHSIPRNTMEPVPFSMRPMWLSFWQYLQIRHRVYLPFSIFAFYCIFWRNPKWERQYKAGKAKPDRPVEEALAIFLLETTAFTWFRGSETDLDGNCIGYFSTQHWGPIRTLLLPKGHHDIKHIEVWINLQSRKAVKVCFDGQEIRFDRAFAQILFLMNSQGHAWTHAVSSWGVMTDHPHPFVRLKSAATLYYNHMGFDGGLKAVSVVANRAEINEAGSERGLLLADSLPYNDQNTMVGPFHAAVQDFFDTPLADELSQYSRFCAFANFLFPHFIRFCDEETTPITRSPIGFFYGTVLHCIDHWMLEQMFCRSANHLAVASSAFQSATEGGFEPNEPQLDYKALGKGTIFAFGLTQDWPKLFVQVYFRNATKDIHFYRKVHEIAKKLDPELAYHLQVCIIK